MDFPPIALLPCRMMLWLASLLVAPANRFDWTEEWFAELWYRFTTGPSRRMNTPLDEETRAGTVIRALRVYRICLGCFADAWWQFGDEEAGKERVLRSVRSPKFCLLLLGCALLLSIVGSSFLSATRKVLYPLPFVDEARLAVVSRTGRMEVLQQGVPQDLAWAWRKQSRLVQALAIITFPRKIDVAPNGKPQKALLVAATPNLFTLLGVNTAATAERRVLYISARFRRQIFSDGRPAIGRSMTIAGKAIRIAGVLPEAFWFLSPAIDLFEIDSSGSLSQGMLLVQCRAGTSTQSLEAELAKTAEKGGYEFARTAPHALFLRDAKQTPLWLFGSALFIGVVLIILAHGSRWLRFDEASDLVLRRSWRWWSFFLLKTTLSLAIVFILGIEIFVGKDQQTITDALGGPALIWFYIVGCSLVLFGSISDQRSRCRVCQRLLAFPIRIGCPGCLFLDWSGTEFLCPQGHGILYVPHHVSCWEEADRWVVLEA